MQRSLPTQEKGMDAMTRAIDGTHWSLTHNMDDSYSHHYANMECTSFQNDRYYSNRSWLSDISCKCVGFCQILPCDNRLFRGTRPKTRVSTWCLRPVRLSSQQTSKVFFCHGQQKKADAIGTCHHNAEVPAGMTMDNVEGRVSIMKDYRVVLVLALDSTTEKDHIFEIICEAYMSRVLPVMVGPTI